MTARTSRTHPLQIATIPVGEGAIGVSFCPGKQQCSAMSGVWARDLDVDLDAVKAWGAAAVVTLVEAHELAALKVERMGEAVTARGMRWFHLPIPDVTAPGPAFEEAWRRDGALIRQLLRQHERVFVHCKGGLGRAGTVAARLLVELDRASPDEAIALVRKARGAGAIETREQEAHVRSITPVQDAAITYTAGGSAVTSNASGSREDRAVGALLGLTVGDAVGTTLEFQPRDSYQPLTDMIGGGPFRLPVGVWTDDTSMALALADSLTAGGTLDPEDLMRRFVSWWREGSYSATGTCFDIGNAISAALARFERSGDPMAGSTDAMSAGNGSLMRLSPVAIWGVRAGEAATRAAAREQSATTHAAAACLDACEGYALILRAAILGAPFAEAVRVGEGVGADPIAAILAGGWRGKARGEIKSSGYVAHSLEAALWCVAKTENYRDAILLAANLGDDADTTAAITGQLAGALYGASGIPEDWRSKVAWGRRIASMALALLNGGN
ncbi:ADP-ribosylglycohydrolase family protein [Sphingomonas corticis]|jgi:ADP-ribosyl-[dinitrogen reductase] hydrolase|uniref:Tyrosine specific protein phosphatases domain-containing protein n=1 Tax=Sphingomonas corticis TaxID=2722791 RepID=A0ABX1CWK8_9SPHN|nr:ADP-ribosylglycohydrolase family protein [Sphingomonas corticis]NJR80360.1 hypothetical protein [Sphingomonas corticis]